MGVLDKFLNAMKLNDDGFDDDKFLDDEVDDYEESRPKKRFFKKLDDDEEMDDFGYDNVEAVKQQPEKKQKTSRFQNRPSYQASSVAPVSAVKPSVSSTSKISPIRPKKGGSNMEVCVIKPASMEDTREIADTLLDNATVILNLEGIDVELAQRIIDFASGACYSLNGSLQKISSYIFVLGPSSVDITGDLQNILGGATPSVRAGY